MLQRSSSAAVFVLLAASAAVAQVAPPAPSAPPARVGAVEGMSKGSGPKVTIDADNDRVDEILRELSDQAGWDLVVVGPRRAMRQRLTLRFENKPAGDVLDVVLSMAGLSAELRAGILTVRAPGVAGATAPGGGDDDETHERVVIGQPLTINAGETVEDAVVVGGPLTVRGHVMGDAVAIGGPASIEEGAVIDGDVVAVGGPLLIDDGAIVRGDRVNVGGPIGGLARLAARLGTDGVSPWALAAFDVAATLLRALSLLLLALLLVAFVPERVDRTRQLLTHKPGNAAAAGLALFVGFVPFCLLLVVTIVGIALVPLAVLALIALLVFGLTALAELIGERMPLWTGRKTRAGAVLLGVAVIALVDFIPWFGTPLVLIAAFVAAGAALLSRFGGQPKAPREVVVTPTA